VTITLPFSLASAATVEDGPFRHRAASPLASSALVRPARVELVVAV